MIRLHGDALWFCTEDGDAIPCSVEAMAFELVDGTGQALDAELIRNAAQAVLHYFRNDLGRTQVTVGDFVQAFTNVLRSLGLSVEAQRPTASGVAESDLRCLAEDTGGGFELVFFARLRTALRQALAQSPSVVRFQGLRGCVKQLSGTRRWNRRCQMLSDQIVAFLRDCLTSEPRHGACSLVIE